MLSNPPLFILGAPRSGTTLLAKLLEHTRYGRAFETHFIPGYYKKLQQYGDLSLFPNFKKLVTDILNERVVMHWELNLDIEAFFNRLDTPITYNQIINQLCLISENKTKHEYWGDKTPQYLEHIDIIYHLFSNAKYIVLIRDGRDVALSLLKKTWGPNNIYACAQYWKKLNSRIVLLEKLAKPEQLFYLRYEDLLNQCPQQIKKLNHFFNESNITLDKEKLCASVNTSNSDKWKAQLSPGQIQLFEKIAAKTLQKYGYSSSHDESTIPKTRQYLYQLHDKILLSKHLFILNVIDTIKIRYFGKKPFDE